MLRQLASGMLGCLCLILGGGSAGCRGGEGPALQAAGDRTGLDGGLRTGEGGDRDSFEPLSLVPDEGEGGEPPLSAGQMDAEDPDVPARPGAPDFAFPHRDPAPVDHLARARESQAAGDHAVAMLELEKALHDDPANFTAALLLGDSAELQGQTQLAVDAWLLAASLRPDEAEPWVRLARGSLSRGDLDEAEQMILRAIRLDPGRALSHNLRGRIWLARSHWERATACFERALELSPESIHVRNNLGLALVLRRDFQQAVQILEPLGQRPLTPAYMLNNLGLAYEGLGRLPEAAATFRQALDREPRYLKAQLNLVRLTEVAQRVSPELPPEVQEPSPVPEEATAE